MEIRNIAASDNSLSLNNSSTSWGATESQSNFGEDLVTTRNKVSTMRQSGTSSLNGVRRKNTDFEDVGDSGFISLDIDDLDFEVSDNENSISNDGVTENVERKREWMIEDHRSTDGEQTKTKRYFTPEQKAKKIYKNALSSFKKLSAKNPEELTEKEMYYLKKNQMVISNYEEKRHLVKEKSQIAVNSTAPNLQMVDPNSSSENSFKLTAKRVRTDVEEEKSSKKLKPLFNIDQAPEDCQVAVIDRLNLEGRMLPERWVEVERRILIAIAELWDGNGDKVAFEGAGWQGGVKIIGCSNQRSLDFLKEVINRCGELWPGAILDVIPRSYLPLRRVINVWIPPPLMDDQTILKIIMAQNKELDTRSWRIISSAPCTNGVGKELIVSVDDRSMIALRNTEGSIKFGLNVVNVRLPQDEKVDRNMTSSAI